MIEDIDNVKKDIKDYIEVKTDLIRLHIAENVSRILTTSVNVAIIGYLVFFILLFLSMAGGFLLSTLLNSYVLGFLGLSLCYILLLILFLLFRKQLVERRVIKSMMKLFFPKFNNDEA